jgi:hypothetical protein
MTTRRVLRLLAVAAVLPLIALLFVWLDPLGLQGTGELGRALSQRGRVAVLGTHALLSLRAEGASLFDVGTIPELTAALRGNDPARLLLALEHAGAQALLVETSLASAPGASLGARVARLEHVAGLRGLYLSRAAALYAPDPVQELTAAERQALAVVARALLGAARRPKANSFPEALRRLRPVEVMVLLREGTTARLWRSARGSSIATALITAAVVARERWQERERAMGEPLAAALGHMDVEVALIEDDGTIGDREPAFVDHALFAPHGVGYERKGAWRYLLPEATQEAGRGRASRAYRKLFTNDGLPADSFGRHDLRLYRLVVESLATSSAPPPRVDALSPLASPDELLHAPRP